MNQKIRKTRSICPKCRRNLPAALVRDENSRVFLERTCPEHGSFRTLVWQGRIDPDLWTLGADPLAEGMGESCPNNCGLCPEHEESTCCILLEITNRCNLHCRFCFADGGEGRYPDPPADELKEAICDIVRRCGKPLLQFSGGEPTLRDDLPELVRYAKEAGCSYTQLNTNGIRLAEDPAYAKSLADAGLDIVFLQFDGTKEKIYETLRGKALLETKKEAIRVCSDLNIGVTLVPTIVPGVNDGNLGEIVSFAVSHAPGVRGVHFQPVSYFGRVPDSPEENRYTLDELIAGLAEQAGISYDSFLPSRCDHPLCGFHSSFLIEPDGSLSPLSSITHSSRTRSCASANREYVARHWRRDPSEAGSPSGTSPAAPSSGEMDFDTFLHRLRHNSMTLSAMAFQDAGNLNIERLHRCSLHVYEHGRVVPFCSYYL